MTDIPRSVMEDARKVLAFAFRSKEDAETIIARALIARDKRAAEIARRRTPFTSKFLCDEQDEIAKEILTYDTPTGQEDGT